MGKMRYTLGGYIGAVCIFWDGEGTLTGLSIKYFLARFPDGIEVMEGGYMKTSAGYLLR